MNTMKIILIDGISAIINEENFIKDEIPRYLSSLVEKDYKIWLNVYDSNFDNLDYDCIPVWLSRRIISINSDIYNSINSLQLSKDCFIISSDSERAKLLNLKLKSKFNILLTDEVFDNYHNLEIADMFVCFGFNKTEFFKLCKEQNFLGLDGNEHINLNSKNHKAFAYLIKTEEIEQEYTNALKKFNSMIESGKYNTKHNKYIIGLTYKGKGIKDADLNILNGKKLPILLI
jgi:hypothetical protein